MDNLYFNVSLLEVDVEADQDEADVDEKRKQATDDKEHLGENYLVLIMIWIVIWKTMTLVLREIIMMKM